MTLAETQALYALYRAAEAAILGGQQYQIGDRMMKRADLQFVVAERRRLGQDVTRLSASRGRLRYVIPQ